jgi:ABC-type phosphate transport system substrate-binding protein
MRIGETQMTRNYCKYLVLFFIVAPALLLILSASANAQISVVVSASSKNAPNNDDLKAIFLAIKAQWPDGGKVQLLDQPESPLAETFYSKLVGKSINQVRKDWTKLILSGQIAAPTKCAGDDAVKKALAANPNAIGFIASSALDGSVKEVLRVQ